MTEYIILDQRIHLLCQSIAKVNRTLVPKKEDDSHTNLYFDPIEKRMYGHWFNEGKEKLICTLDLQTLNFEFLNDRHEVCASVLAIGKIIIEIEQEIEKSLFQLGIPTEGIALALDFEIPKYDFADKQIEILDPESLKEWCGYRAIANSVCNDLLGLAQVPGEVRIWPHHFDTGIYFEPNTQIGIGFGLAMEDSIIRCPYYYLSAYPKNGSINYEDAPTSDNWAWEISDDFKGCVLPLTLLKGLSENERNILISDYLSTNYHWLLKQ
jgi:hypothetical protein